MQLYPVRTPLSANTFAFLIKRKWLVFSCLAIIFGVVALATMRSTRIYDAFGSIAINKTDPAILNFKESASGGGRTITIPPTWIPKYEFSRVICWPCR